MTFADFVVLALLCAGVIAALCVMSRGRGASGCGGGCSG